MDSASCDYAQNDGVFLALYAFFAVNFFLDSRFRGNDGSFFSWLSCFSWLNAFSSALSREIWHGFCIVYLIRGLMPGT
jgi:hypothetical protein